MFLSEVRQRILNHLLVLAIHEGTVRSTPVVTPPVIIEAVRRAAPIHFLAAVRLEIAVPIAVKPLGYLI